MIVHEPRFGASGYTAGGVRHETQGRWRISFTTNLPVFSLERKKRLLPETLRETFRWLYVKDIEILPEQDTRCLSIGSPDHTYLVAGYVRPTTRACSCIWLRSARYAIRTIRRSTFRACSSTRNRIQPISARSSDP